MTANLDIIKGAMKKIHVLASGAEPTAQQAASVMTALQDLMCEVIGGGSLGRLYDVLATQDCTALEWQRIRASAGVVVTLPTTITSSIANAYPYGFSADGGGWDYGWYYQTGFCGYPRAPFNLAPIVVIDSDGNETMSIYSAYAGAWVTINGLDEQDDFPFPRHLENGFKAMLAERICDDFDQELGASTARQAAIGRMTLCSRFDSASRPAVGSYF